MKLGVNTVLFKPFSVLEAMQAIYDKHRALFDAADNATPEEIKQAADYLEFLKSQR